jgi:hypothetical protein
MINYATITCPTCKRKAEPQSRYCPACYTVFPSDAQSRNRGFGARSSGGAAWAFPSLFVLAIATIWFVQINPYDWTAEPGSYRAVSRDMKRSVIQWFDWPSSNEPTAPPPSTASGNGSPAWALDNDNRLPCDRGAICEVVIHFRLGKSAHYFLERPNHGSARLSPKDPQAAELLSKATQGRLAVDQPQASVEPILITRKDDRWSIVNSGERSTTDSNAVPPGGKEGV